MPSPQCPVCYELFAGWKDVAACPCGHTFHYHCILRWSEDCKRARKKPECPTCKTTLDVDKQPKCLVPKLFFSFDGDGAEKEWISGVSSSANDSDVTKLRDDLASKNALTYTLQNRVTALERTSEDWQRKMVEEQLKREKTEQDLRDERSKRDAFKRQMEGFKLQAGDVKKVHAENEVLRKKLDECRTIEKVLKESTNQVETELLDHGRSAEELAKYLIILKREMERHIGEKRKLKEEAKRASEENFKYENEIDRLKRENELRQEKMTELRKDNAALMRRVRLTPSSASKRRHPLSGGSENAVSPPFALANIREKLEEEPLKKRRISEDLDASMDLFGSPSCPRDPGIVVTPSIPRASFGDLSPSSLGEGILSQPKLDSKSPSVFVARDAGVKYVKTTTDFDSISRKAAESVVTPESVKPIRRPCVGGGLLGRGAGGVVRSGFNATGGTSKFLDIRSQSIGSGASCGGGIPRVSSVGSSSSKIHKSIVEQQKRNKFAKHQPPVSNFFG